MTGGAESLPDGTSARAVVSLPSRLEAQLRAARCCGALLALDHATDAELVAADVAVLDPLTVPREQHEALAARLLDAALPCVLYTHASSAALEAVASLQRADPVHVLIAGVDDGIAELRTTLARAARHGDSMTLRRALTPRISPLAPTVQFALDLLLRRPEQFFDAVDLARHAGLSRRHVDRMLQVHGLAPAKRWIIAARVWHAMHLQRRHGLPLSRAAERLGYADAKALRRHRASVLAIGDADTDAGAGTPGLTARQWALTRVVAYLTCEEGGSPSAG